MQWAGPFVFPEGSCGYGKTLLLSSTATTDANESGANHRFFRTGKDLGLFKAERDLGPSVPPRPPGDEVTHTRTWNEQKEMRQCPGQVPSTWPGGFHLGSAEGLPKLRQHSRPRGSFLKDGDKTRLRQNRLKRPPLLHSFTH